MAKIELIEIEVNIDATKALRQLKRLKKMRHRIWNNAFWTGWAVAIIGSFLGKIIYNLLN